MKIDAAPLWLKAHVDMLKPASPLMQAFETAERVIRAGREREASIALEREATDMKLTHWSPLRRMSRAFHDASAELDRIALITDDPEAVELAASAVFKSLSDMIARETSRVRRAAS